MPSFSKPLEKKEIPMKGKKMPKGMKPPKSKKGC